MLLAGLGAGVIRVDRVSEVDLPPHVDVVTRRARDQSPWTSRILKGASLVRSLASRADGFVDVYRPGVAERLGIGPEDLLGLNSRLVYARMTGYGQDGPYAQMAGHDINFIALSGALHAYRTGRYPCPAVEHSRRLRRRRHAPRPWPPEWHPREPSIR